MPVLYAPDGSSAVFDSPEEVKAALASGWSLPASGTVEYTRPVSGRVVELPPEGQALLPGAADYGVADDTAKLEPALEGAVHHAYSGLGDQLLGAAEGAGSVLSLGASDAVLDSLGADTALREKHTVGRTVGELAAVAGLVAAPTAAAGRLGQLLLKATPAGRVTAFGLRGETALARVAHTVGEGAAWGVGQTVSNIALREPGVVAESVVAELGQGALLGAALGGAFGGLGEGVRAIAKAREARRVARGGAFDLKSGPAREGLDGLAKGFKEIDESIDHAASNMARNADEAKGALNAEWSAKLRGHVDEVYRNATQPRKYFSDELATGIQAARDAVLGGNHALKPVTDLVEFTNAAAKELRIKAPISRQKLTSLRGKVLAGKDITADVVKLAAAADDILAKQALGVVDPEAEKLVAKFLATGDDAAGLEFLHHARKSGAPGVPEWVDEILGKLKVDADAIEASAAAMKPPVFDKGPVRAILGLRDGEEVTAATFERLLSLPPQRLIAKAQELGEYYAAAQKAVAGNPLAETRIAEALVAQRKALASLVPDEVGSALTPQAIAAILGVSVVPDLEGPADDVVKAAVVAKLLGGMKGMRLAARKSYAKRVAGAIGRRMMAGSFAGTVAATPMLKGLPSSIRGGAIGGGASAGFEFASLLERAFSKYTAKGAARGGDDMAYREALNAAVKTELNAKAKVTGSVERLATGKPNKRASMGPAMSEVLDLLVGEEAKGKSDAEKFKVIQGNLSRFITAPDAVMQNAYEALKPVQQLSEDVADMAEMTLWQQLEYLYEHMPKDPGTMMKLGESQWSPTDRELFEFSMVATGVVAPYAVLDMIADGFVPPQAAQALAATNPEIFGLMQRELADRLNEVRENATYNQLIALGLAFQLPLEPSTDPRYVAFVQEQHAAAELSPPEPSGGGSSKSSSDEYSDAQKLLS